jgi:hypothetical protein
LTYGERLRGRSGRWSDYSPLQARARARTRSFAIYDGAQFFFREQRETACRGAQRTRHGSAFYLLFLFFLVFSQKSNATLERIGKTVRSRARC